LSALKLKDCRAWLPRAVDIGTSARVITNSVIVIAIFVFVLFILRDSFKNVAPTNTANAAVSARAAHTIQPSDHKESPPDPPAARQPVQVGSSFIMRASSSSPSGERGSGMRP